MSVTELQLTPAPERRIRVSSRLQDSKIDQRRPSFVYTPNLNRSEADCLRLYDVPHVVVEEDHL